MCSTKSRYSSKMTSRNEKRVKSMHANDAAYFLRRVKMRSIIDSSADAMINASSDESREKMKTKNSMAYEATLLWN